MFHWTSLRRARGFTLVELMVVMAILASLSLIAIPWFLKISQRNQLKSAAREIQTTLLAARMKAVKRNQPVSVVIVAAGPPIEFQTIEPNPPAPTPTPAPRRLVLPATAAQLYVTPNTTGGAIIFAGDGRVSNITDPQPTPAVITIEGPVGSRTMNRISVNAYRNGRIEVVTPTNWQ